MTGWRLSGFVLVSLAVLSCPGAGWSARESVTAVPWCQLGQQGYWLGMIVGAQADQLVLVLTRRNNDPHTVRCRVRNAQQVMVVTEEEET